MSHKQRFRIHHVETRRTHLIDLDFDARDLRDGITTAEGWSIGAMGSGAAIQLDDPLEKTEIGIFPVSNHLLLLGRASASFPNVYWLDAGGVRGRFESLLQSLRLLGLSRRRWIKLRPDDLDRHAEPGCIYLRFDGRPIRIGRSIIETLGTR